MLVQHTDFELELPGPWQAVEHEDRFEWVRADGSQLLVTVYRLAEEAQPSDVVERFVAIRRDSYKKVDPRCELDAVERSEHDDRLVAMFGTVAKRAGIETFAAAIASTKPVAGAHVLLSFAFTGGKKGRAEGRTLFDGLRFLPHADAIRRAEARSDAPTNLDKLFPYIAPTTYLQDPSPMKQPVRVLGHDLVQLFAEDCDGTCRIASVDTLVVPGLTAEHAVARSLANLDDMLRRKEIPITQLSAGDHKLVRFGDHWLAAACMLLPGVYELAKRVLGTAEIYAAIPHRDVLFVFGGGDPVFVQKARALMREHESEGRKPLTWELFELHPGNPKPVALRN